jgi:hypothetical protein
MIFDHCFRYYLIQIMHSKLSISKIFPWRKSSLEQVHYKGRVNALFDLNRPLNEISHDFLVMLSNSRSIAGALTFDGNYEQILVDKIKCFKDNRTDFVSVLPFETENLVGFVKIQCKHDTDEEQTKDDLMEITGCLWYIVSKNAVSKCSAQERETMKSMMWNNIADGKAS